jgi:hypothetical protein
MRVFAGTERQCTEDEHDDEDEHDSQISEFGLKLEDRNEHMKQLRYFRALRGCRIFLELHNGFGNF